MDGCISVDEKTLTSRVQQIVQGLKAEIDYLRKTTINYEKYINAPNASNFLSFGVNDLCIFARNERGNYIIVSKRKLPMYLYLDPAQQELIAKYVVLSGFAYCSYRERPRFVVARIVEELVQLKATEVSMTLNKSFIVCRHLIAIRLVFQ